MDIRPLLLIGLLACASAQAQDTLQGSEWSGQNLAIKGYVIGWKPGHDVRSGCVLVQADPWAGQPQGRVWACNATLDDVMVRWTIEGRTVQVRGVVSSLQKTRVGPTWRFVPRLENASVR